MDAFIPDLSFQEMFKGRTRCWKHVQKFLFHKGQRAGSIVAMILIGEGESALPHKDISP